jgi:hypothetical protein
MNLLWDFGMPIRNICMEQEEHSVMTLCICAPCIRIYVLLWQIQGVVPSISSLELKQSTNVLYFWPTSDKQHNVTFWMTVHYATRWLVRAYKSYRTTRYMVRPIQETPVRVSAPKADCPYSDSWRFLIFRICFRDIHSICYGNEVASSSVSDVHR